MTEAASMARGRVGAGGVRIASIARSGGATKPTGMSRPAIARHGVTSDSSMNITRSPLDVSEHVAQTSQPKSPTEHRTEANDTMAGGNPIPKINGGGAKRSSTGGGGTPMLALPAASDRS